MTETYVSKQKLRHLAQELGFDDIGVAAVGHGTRHDAHFSQAVNDGLMAPLDYMKRTAVERADIRALMPDAKTVVVVVKNYFTGHHPSADEGLAKVSRYAWGRDYHHWMRKKLRRFRKDILAINSADSERLQVRIFNDTSLSEKLGQKKRLGFVGKSTGLFIGN